MARLERESLISCMSRCDFSDFAKAMADETRQRILALLQAGERNKSDIVAPLKFMVGTTSLTAVIGVIMIVCLLPVAL